VKSEYRNRGIFATMYSNLLAMRMQLDYNTIQLLTTFKNSSAIEIYKKVGMKPEAILMEQHFKQELLCL
jgi:predicted GNAT family acetyltransferase